MASFVFLTGGFPVASGAYSVDSSPVHPVTNPKYKFLSDFDSADTVETSRVQTDERGDAGFTNPTYKFFDTFPALNLPPIKSDKPVLGRVFGWITGG